MRNRRAGTTVNDNVADPDRIAETFLQLHQQHRSTWPAKWCHDSLDFYRLLSVATDSLWGEGLSLLEKGVGMHPA